MSKEYHHQKIDVVIPKHSPLYRRVSAKAKEDGVSVDFVVDMLMSVGTYEMMMKRMDLLEKSDKKEKK